MSKILCPIDFSAPSRTAAHAALRLARALGGEVTFLHVYDYPAMLYFAGAYPTEPLMKELGDEIDTQLAAWQQELDPGKVPVTTVKRRGTPWDEICRAATAEGSDMIVLSTHGRTGLKRALIGSVAEKVVRHAPCDVVVVRHHG